MSVVQKKNFYLMTIQALPPACWILAFIKSASALVVVSAIAVGIDSTTHVTEGWSDPVGLKYFRSDPTDFLSDSFQSDSDPDFVGIRRNTPQIRPDPTRISWGSVGFRWNPIENDRICRSDWLSWVIFEPKIKKSNSIENKKMLITSSTLRFSTISLTCCAISIFFVSSKWNKYISNTESFE